METCQPLNQIPCPSAYMAGKVVAGCDMRCLSEVAASLSL